MSAHTRTQSSLRAQGEPSSRVKGLLPCLGDYFETGPGSCVHWYHSPLIGETGSSSLSSNFHPDRLTRNQENDLLPLGTLFVCRC